MRNSKSSHNNYQRYYFETSDRPRLHVVDTPYVRAHVERMVGAAGLVPELSVLEIGAGIGKFTIPLLERGFRVAGNDLSPVLLTKLAAAGCSETLCGDVVDLPSMLGGRRFDRVIGFFVLHHLIDFDAVFQALAKVVSPGGVVAFCEPVAWNPLYYAQILLTPGMRFRGEPSIGAMRPGVVLPSLRRAGFGEANSVRYGYFPPALKNRAWGASLERALEAMPYFPFPHAFQVFSGRLVG